MAMTIRPESARTAARGDLTVRSWYRRAPARWVAPCRAPVRNARTPDRRGFRLVRVARCATPTSSRPGWSAPAARRRAGRGAPRPLHGRGRRAGRGGGGVGLRCVRRPRRAWRPGSGSGGARFELGHAAERVVARGASTETPAVPDLVFARFDALAVVDPRGGIRCAAPAPGARSSTTRSPHASSRGRVRRARRLPRDSAGAAASIATSTPTA